MIWARDRADGGRRLDRLIERRSEGARGVFGRLDVRDAGAELRLVGELLRQLQHRRALAGEDVEDAAIRLLETRLDRGVRVARRHGGRDGQRGDENDRDDHRAAEKNPPSEPEFWCRRCAKRRRRGLSRRRRVRRERTRARSPRCRGGVDLLGQAVELLRLPVELPRVATELARVNRCLRSPCSPFRTCSYAARTCSRARRART